MNWVIMDNIEYIEISTRFPQIFLFGLIMVLGSLITIYYIYSELWKTDWKYNYRLLYSEYVIPKSVSIDKYIYEDIIDPEVNLIILSERYISDLLSGKTRGSIKIENNKKTTKITVSDIIDRINISDV